MQKGPPEDKNRYRFVYRSAWVDDPDTPSVDTLWAENYEEAIQDAMGIMDRIVVAVYPADEGGGSSV